MTARSGPRARTAVALLAVLSLLPACAAGPNRAASEVLEEVLESHRATIAGLDTPPAPSFSRAATPTVRPAPGSVASLLGQTRDGVLAALGPPTRRRPEGDAEIWLYQGTHCALDVVLYRDSAASRVAWAAARASGTDRRTEAGCLSDLVAGVGTVPAPG